MAQKIDFHFNVPDRWQYACRVIRKARGLNMTIAVWSSDAHKLEYFTRMLCAFDATGFYPIVEATDPIAPDTPIVYCTDGSRLTARDLLILLDDQIPADFVALFARFSRIIDIVPQAENERAWARQRFMTYRQQGFTPVAHDQGSKHE